MRSRHQFRPSVVDLETRVVLSSIRPNLGYRSVLLARMPGSRMAPQQPVVARINAEFDAFIEDYSQARGTYFAAIEGMEAGAGADAARQAFVQYTNQRVNLLSQELLDDLISSSRGGRDKGSRGPGISEQSSQLLARRISGRQQDPGGAPAENPFSPGTLGNSLIESIPPAGVSGPSATLYTLAQDDAIEAARVGVVNGINAYKLNALDKKSRR